MGMVLVAKHVVVKKQGNVAYYPVHLTVKNRLPAVHVTNKTRCLSFKSGHAVTVAKLIKKDLLTLLHKKFGLKQLYTLRSTYCSNACKFNSYVKSIAFMFQEVSDKPF